MYTLLFLKDINAKSFLDLEAEDSSGSNSEEEFQKTEADDEFIDDSLIEGDDNILEVQREHHRNVKRIAKNLDEFSDCLSFDYTDLASLKSFILQML